LENNVKKHDGGLVTDRKKINEIRNGVYLRSNMQ